MKKTREEKIMTIEEIIAKQKAELAKSEAALAVERNKLRDEQIKKLEGICKKGGCTISDIIRLAEAVIDNNVTINDVISLVGGTTADVKEEQNNEKNSSER